MFTAAEAKKNVYEYNYKISMEIEKACTEIIDSISVSVEFHSKCGITELAFAPYTKSRFPSSFHMDGASRFLSSTLKQNGYKILMNEPPKNILKIGW